jgi:type II secretory pathway component GspD/PulD (secretin)
LGEGQVAILGGIRVSSRGDEKSGLPILGEFPPLSWLFGNRKKSSEDSELLIALTVYRVPRDSNPMPVRRAESVR